MQSKKELEKFKNKSKALADMVKKQQDFIDKTPEGKQLLNAQKVTTKRKQ